MAQTVSLNSGTFYNIRRGAVRDFAEFKSTWNFVPYAEDGVIEYRVGSETQMKAIVGKVIRGFRLRYELVCRADFIESYSTRIRAGNGISFYGLTLSGNRAGYLPLLRDLYAFESLAFGAATRTFQRDGQGDWFSREEEAAGSSANGWLSYGTPTYSKGGERLPQRTYRRSTEFPDTSIPIGYMSNEFTDVKDPDSLWGGFILEISPTAIVDSDGVVEIRSEHKFNMTAFSVVVSDKPTWTATAPQSVGVGKVATDKIEGRAWYPDAEDDPVKGLVLTVTCNAAILSLSLDGERFGPTVFATTDDAGNYSVFVRGEKSGTSDIKIECKNAAVRSMFAPAFSASGQVKVFDGNGVGDDGDPPADDGDIKPGAGGDGPYQDGEDECIIYPPITFLPSVPAHFDTVNIKAWDAGANSVDQLDGDMVLRFDMPKVVGVVIGLHNAAGARPVPAENPNALNDVSNRDRIPYALYFHQSAGGGPLVNVMERGKTVTPDAPYVAGTFFEIRRIGGTVSYWYDDALVYTAQAPSAGELLATTAVFASGDTIP